jgi:hypothetical protein
LRCKEGRLRGNLPHSSIAGLSAGQRRKRSSRDFA